MMFADDLSDEAIDAMLAAAEAEHRAGRSSTCAASAAPSDGSPPTQPRSRTGTAATSWPSSRSGWTPRTTPSCTSSGRSPCGSGCAPKDRACYVNFLEEEGADRVRDAYPPRTYERLAAVERRYDPNNLFRLNQNIPPTAEALAPGRGQPEISSPPAHHPPRNTPPAALHSHSPAHHEEHGETPCTHARPSPRPSPPPPS